MEAWLAELEIKMDSAPTFINNLCHQKETMELSFEEQIAATLGQDLSYLMCAENNTTSPQQWDFDCDVMERITWPSQFFSNNCNQNDVIINDNVNNNENDNRSNSNSNSNNNNDNENDNNNIVSSNCNVQERQQQLRCEEETKKQGGTKRKRHPSQVQDHIIAERRRRELLSQMFISLSAIVPGLKKVDKTSVLGEAIKYMKQLQEKVKVLEEVATKRRVVVVKNTHVMNNDDIDSSSTVDDDSSGGGSGETNNYNDSLPEIEVKISGKTLLLRVSCEDQKGILTKLFGELDKHDISVTSCSLVPFDTLPLDITIVAQVKERGFNDNVEGFIRSLRSALRINC